MKKMIPLLLASVISLMLAGQDFKTIDPVTKDLRLEMAEASANDLLRVNIRLKDQFDATEFMSRRNNLSREQIRQQLISELQTFTHSKQKNILEELNYYSRSGEVNEIKALWIANVINCYATPTVIEQLATRSDVERIDIDEERILLFPFQVEEDNGDLTREITYNVLKVRAPEVWELGFTGEGIVVAILDTGVNYNHNDLQGNMWTHPDYPFHGWNFINNNNNPMDFHGHGTHCAGTVAGNGASGSQTGIAPGAKIMALQVLSSSGGGSESGVWSGIQFGVEKGAHILSLSLGWLHAWGPDRATWRTTMNNALAAGVIASVAAGNEGDMQFLYPVPSNVRTPGDCPPPWLHPNQTLIGGVSAVVSVGATNINDNLADFSARGPVTWQNVSGYNDYPFNPGMGLIRPDVVAPGVSVKSLSHSSNNGYTNMTGTSMAAPAAAGVMALMLSKNNAVLPEEISQILEENTFVLTPGKNNNSGSGRVDALEAINATNFPGPVYLSHTFSDPTGNNDGNINPSEYIQLTIALLNNTDVVFENVEATVFTNSPYITMINSVALYGTFQPGDTIAIANAFSFQVAENIPGGHLIEFFVVTGDGIESWESSFEVNAFAPVLGSGSMIVFDPAGNANGILDPGESASIQIPTFNIGQHVAQDVQVTFTTQSNHVTILTSQFDLGNLNPGASSTAIFPVTVSAGAPLGANVVFNYTVTSGAYVFQRTYTHKIGMMLEDFETGDFSKYNWVFSGNAPWAITNVNTYEGQFSARSGAISHNQNSIMQLSMSVAQHDSISFYLRTSSEANFDFLRFYIGTTMVGQWSGNVPWQRVAYAVTPGSRTFRWEYDKDGSISSGSDRAWVDYITLPQPLVTTAFAGSDILICEGSMAQLQGTAMNHTFVLWQTSGSGTFSNTKILNPVYTPSQQDILAGGVILTLTVRNAANDIISDQLALNIQRQADVFAGNDQMLCVNNNFFTADAMAEYHGGIFWSSSGTGIFADVTSLHTTYTPSQADLEAGSVILTLHAYGISPCSDNQSSMVLTFIEPVVLSLEDELIVCGNGVAALSATVENFSSIIWSTSGTGTFSNPNIPNPVYTPSQLDFAAGSVTLSIEVTALGPCDDVTETVTITLAALPTAAISGNATICEGQSTTIEFVLTGAAPWVVSMGEGMEVIEINESPFLWVVQPASTRVYNLYSVVDANGCEVMEAGQVTVTVNPLPLVPAMPAGADTVDFAYNTSSVYTIEETVTATGYQWAISPVNAGTFSANGTSITINWSSSFIGNVSIHVKSINDCGESAYSESKVMYLKNTTGTGNLNAANNVRIFPNPSDGFFTLELKNVRNQAINIRVYNLLGRMVESFHVNAGTGTSSHPLDLRHLPDGLYMMKIQHQDGTLSNKLIINR